MLHLASRYLAKDLRQAGRAKRKDEKVWQLAFMKGGGVTYRFGEEGLVRDSHRLISPDLGRVELRVEPSGDEDRWGTEGNHMTVFYQATLLLMTEIDTTEVRVGAMRRARPGWRPVRYTNRENGGRR